MSRHSALHRVWLKGSILAVPPLELGICGTVKVGRKTFNLGGGDLWKVNLLLFPYGGYAYYYFCSTLMPKKDNCNAVDKDMPSDVCRRLYISFPLKVEIKLDAQTAFSTIISLIVMPLIPIVPQLGMVFTPLNVLPCSPTMCLPFTVIF